MKIKSSNYPFLSALAKGHRFMEGLGWCRVEDSLYPKIIANIEKMTDMWNYILNSYQLGELLIDYVTKPIIQNFDVDKNNAEALHSMRDEVKSSTGVYLVAGTSFAHAYIILNMSEDKSVGVCVFTFFEDSLIGFSDMIYEYGTYPKYFVNTESSFYCGHHHSKEEFAYGVQTVVTYELFKEYAELKYKEIDGTGAKAPKKIKIGKEKILNEIPVKINIMDSTYFTTISRKGKIEVTGHFRQQAHGKNYALRKKIWINSFKKDGYTRVAKKLK